MLIIYYWNYHRINFLFPSFMKLLNSNHLFSFVLPVLLFCPTHGPEGVACCFGVRSSVASKYGQRSHLVASVILSTYGMITSSYFLYNTWLLQLLLRLSLVRRWLRQSLPFLTSLNKYVMQFRPGQRKVCNWCVFIHLLYYCTIPKDTAHLFEPQHGVDRWVIIWLS